MGRGVNGDSSNAVALSTRATAGMTPQQRDRAQARVHIDSLSIKRRRADLRGREPYINEKQQAAVMHTLSREEQNALIVSLRALEGSDDPRDRRGLNDGREVLLLTNSGFIESIVHDNQGWGLPLERVREAARWAMINATKTGNFDPDNESGAAFITYARSAMDRAIHAEVRREPDHPMQLRSMNDDLPRVRRSIDNLRRKHGRWPDIEEIAQESNLTADQVLTMLPHSSPRNFISLDDHVARRRAPTPLERTRDFGEMIDGSERTRRRHLGGWTYRVSDPTSPQEREAFNAVDVETIDAAIASIENPVRRYMLREYLAVAPGDDPPKQTEFLDGLYTDSNGTLFTDEPELARIRQFMFDETVEVRPSSVLRKQFRGGQMHWRPLNKHSRAIFEMTGQPPTSGSVQSALEYGVKELSQRLEGIQRDYIYRGPDEVSQSETARTELARRLLERGYATDAIPSRTKVLISVGRKLGLVDDNGKLVPQAG